MYLFLIPFDVVLMVHKDVRSSLRISQSPCRDNDVGADGSDSPVGLRQTPPGPLLSPRHPLINLTITIPQNHLFSN